MSTVLHFIQERYTALHQENSELKSRNMELEAELTILKNGEGMLT
jgi:cell division protein FtsB